MTRDRIPHSRQDTGRRSPFPVSLGRCKVVVCNALSFLSSRENIVAEHAKKLSRRMTMIVPGLSDTYEKTTNQCYHVAYDSRQLNM